MRSSHPFWAAGLALVSIGCVGSVEDGRNTAPGKQKPGGGDSTDPPDPGDMGGGGPGPAGLDAPGRTPLRRLTKAQYDNTIRDLLGINESLASSFGLDEEDGGFQSNAKAPVKELQIERYQQTAEDLAARAVANPGMLARSCTPPRASDTACVDDVIKGFGKRAYRRPLTAAEVSRYQQIFAAGKGATGDLAAGLSLVVSTMLQSPWFLYRPELGAGTRDGVGQPLSQYEVASRLSYFLQNTMPDQELFAAADAGKLGKADEIATHARRLLGSDRARDTIVSFYQQWLGIDDLLTVEKDEKAFPAFNAELLAAMKDEVLEFADQVTRQGDGKLATLLGAQFSFVRGPLYQLYGVQGSGTTLKKVELPAGQRAGVMTLPAVMTRHAHSDQSSLVGRGYLVSDKLLCIVPPAPPDGADNNIPKPDPNVSARERFAMHRAKPECAGCHALMDPLGIAFEIYDGIGRYRTMDGNQRVDASSELSGTDRDGPVKNAVDLLDRLAQSSEVRACMARQWFRYAFGRADTPDDAATVAAALEVFKRADHSIPELMVALTTTGNFRYRKPLAP